MDRPHFRLWTYRSPAIVLGCSQHRLRPLAEARLPAGVALLERATGGGAVLTGPWLVGVSVLLPPEHAWVCGGLLESYRRLALLHVAVLAGLGVAAQAVPPAEVQAAAARTGAPVDWACFGGLGPWELTDEQGRKLTGLAQRRQHSGVLLVAGSLVSAPPWAMLCRVLGRDEDVAALARRTVSCDALAGRPVAPLTLAAALQRALQRELPGSA